MDCVIGVDVGTNGTKAMLLSGSGKVLNFVQQSYPLYPVGARGIEQRAEDWLDAVKTCVRAVAPEDKSCVRAISFSTQGGATLAVDRAGRPLNRAVSWMDTRAVPQAERMKRFMPEERRYRETGTVPSPCYSAAHIMLMKDEMPEVFSSADRFVTTLDYLNMNLTGICAIDATNALMTGMYNIKQDAWHARALEAVGIGEDRLASLLPAGRFVGKLTAEAAKELNLSPDTEVICGAHDQYASAVGCGAVAPGEFMLSCGTAWVLLGVFPDIALDDTMALTPGRHAVPGMYGAFYAISVGSAALNWQLDQSGLKKEDLPEINRVCAERIEKAKDVFFFPYLGEAVPLDKLAKAGGAFLGLTLGIDRYDMALSVMESIAFETARAVRHFEKNGCPVRALRMFGGASKSDLWAEILSAVTGREVLRSDQPETACLGAAILAGVGCGLFASFEQAAALCRGMEKRLLASGKMRAHYAGKFDRYLQTHKKLY